MSDKLFQLNASQSLAISTIRAIATLMIISCHVMQGYNHFLAWWINVGVHIFLFMSGFLLAHSDYTNKLVFLKKRLKRILIPYWLFLLLVLPIFYYYTGSLNIGLKQIPKYLIGTIGFNINVTGIEHLWFLSLIIYCYVTAIFLSYLRNISCRLSASVFYLGLGAFFYILHRLETATWIPFSYAAGIATFVLAFFISCRYQGQIPRKLVIGLGLTTAVTTLIRIYFEHLSPVNKLPVRYVPWSKFFLGSFLFVTMYLLFSKINWETLPKTATAIRTLAFYSYEIYLTHQIFILGPFSLLNLTSLKIVNLLVIAVLVTVSTVFLKWLSELVLLRLTPKKTFPVSKADVS